MVMKLERHSPTSVFLRKQVQTFLSQETLVPSAACQRRVHHVSISIQIDAVITACDGRDGRKNHFSIEVGKLEYMSRCIRLCVLDILQEAWMPQFIRPCMNIE